MGEHQAAGRPRHLPGRQADHPAGRRAPGEPRLRHRPPVVRDELVVRQPGAGADRAVDDATEDAASIRSACTCCPSTSTRRWRACSSPSSAPADRAHRRAGALHRRRAGGRTSRTRTATTVLTDMRIAVMGAGGVGGYFGARLRRRATKSPSSRAARILRRCARTACASRAPHGDVVAAEGRGDRRSAQARAGRRGDVLRQALGHRERRGADRADRRARRRGDSVPERRRAAERPSASWARRM